jgi:coproporphyrinogen III oxidase
MMSEQGMKENTAEFFRSLQDRICQALEGIDAKGKFGTDSWQRPGGGGGTSRVLERGGVFEKGGVNFSQVYGKLPAGIADKLGANPGGFFATGISLVLHPESPMVPTVHANLRYFEMDNGDAWFGGGTDLTPYYHFPEDTIHFHSVLKKACDSSDPTFYPRFKKWCDEYFFLKHRGETRGVGGIFFDYLRGNPEKYFSFVRFVGDAFLDAYLPVVERRKALRWGDAEKSWQLVRRGRYAEFNLVQDRGTLFGLETNGRVESILMSLPPVVHWHYNMVPASGTREDDLVQILRKPREWVTP